MADETQPKHQLTAVKIPINSATWTQISPAGLGAAYTTCVSHATIIVIADDEDDADTQFLAGNFDLLAADAEMVIWSWQSEYKTVYAKCNDSDVNTFNIGAVAFADGAIVPNTVTITTAAHGLAVGDFITIAGCTALGVVYNKLFKVIAVPLATTLTFYDPSETFVPYVPAGGGTETCVETPTFELSTFPV